MGKQSLLVTFWSHWKHGPTHRRVWSLALPMIASNLTVPLVTLVDSIIAGHLPHAQQLASVALGGSVFTVLVWLCGFLRMGTTGLAAQAAGRRDGSMLRTVLVQSQLLALSMAILTLLIVWPLLPRIMDWMHASPRLHALAIRYLHIRLPALPAALANYALAGWFLGNQNARAAFAILVMTNLANIGLNLLFVLGFHWGVNGIALASMLGAWSGTVSGLILVTRELRVSSGQMQWHKLKRWLQWKPLIAVNRDIFIRSLALQGVFFSLTLLGTRLGDNIIAANALLLNGLMLVSFALDGLANAVEAMSGHAIGEGNRQALMRSLIVSGGWSFIGSLGFSAFFLLGGRLFIDLQTSIESVRHVAYTNLIWLVLLPVIAIWSFLLDGLFVGAARGREMRNCMIISAIGFVLLAGLLLPPLANTGLWLAFLGFMALRGITMAWTARHISAHHHWMKSSFS